MLIFILVFSFLHRHNRLLFSVFFETIVCSLIMSDKIDKSTVIKIIICSIINIIIKIERR